MTAAQIRRAAQLVEGLSPLTVVNVIEVGSEGVVVRVSSLDRRFLISRDGFVSERGKISVSQPAEGKP